MKKKSIVIPIITFFMLSMVLTGIFLAFAHKTVDEKQDRHLYIASSQANIMKDCVDTAIARVYTFSALIRNNEGDTAFFDTEAETIYKEIVVDSQIPIKNVAIAPNGIVEKVYPLAGNEQLIGFDFMDTTKEGNTEAVEAYEKGDVIVTNPFELVQGGTGMAGRLPVFVKKDGTEQFWGLVTVTLDFDKMIRGFHLDNLSHQNINYRLWCEDGAGGVQELAASDAVPDNPVTYDFNIQNLKWYLSVEPVNGWQSSILHFFIILGIIGFSAVIALLLYDKNKIHYVNEQLESLANRDNLTGCYSRNYVNTCLVDPQNGEWKDPNSKYSLAIVDIDSFKKVNDTYGHEVGDWVIVQVARILKLCSREVNGDCVLRYGGDEFIVLWNDITRERFVGKMTQIVEKARLISFSEYPELKISISVGGEMFSGENYFTMNKKADQKLYVAKGKGKNQYVL